LSNIEDEDKKYISMLH